MVGRSNPVESRNGHIVYFHTFQAKSKVHKKHWHFSSCARLLNPSKQPWTAPLVTEAVRLVFISFSNLICCKGKHWVWDCTWIPVACFYSPKQSCLSLEMLTCFWILGLQQCSETKSSTFQNHIKIHFASSSGVKKTEIRLQEVPMQQTCDGIPLQQSSWLILEVAQTEWLQLRC